MVRPCAVGGKTCGSRGDAISGLRIDVEHVAAAGLPVLQALGVASAACGVDGRSAWKPPALRFLTSALRALGTAGARAHFERFPLAL